MQGSAAVASEGKGEQSGARKRETVTEWTWRKGLVASLPHYPPIIARSSRLPVELSFGQQRLWFLAQLESGSAAYNVPMAWRIAGAIDVAALRQSLDRLVTRHEALRTTFPAEAGEPRQLIHPPAPAGFELIDLRGVEGRASELERRVREFTERPFDLTAAPLMRTALFRLRDEQHVFALVLHHIVCDGPSIAILLEELGLFYDRCAKGWDVEIPPPSVQYADFSIWQREALSKEVRNPQLSYWREQLRDCPAALDFPSQSAPSVGAGFRGDVEYRDLSASLSEDFRSLARRQGVTRFMGLLALFQVLLSRYTGETDVAVGCPMTHRFRAEVSRVVGFFANMMVLRSRLEGNPTFRDLLRRTREVALGAYAHQDLPFEELVAELQPARIPGRNPFFQAMLVVEESAWRHLELAGCRCAPLPVHNGTSKFDFSLYVIDHPEGFRLVLEYNSDLFEAETAARLLAHYERLLAGAVADPEARVCDLPLLSVAEQQEILRRWNETCEENGDTAPTPSLFEAQVERAPDAIAIRFKEEELTYRELNARANRLAHHLTSEGAGAGVLVAICLERSLELVIAMLAIMKAGAAYLPLDPLHPSARRDGILRESGAKILISDQDPGPAHGCTVVRLNQAEAIDTRYSDENPHVEIRANDLAYVIYTSGSTGHPKGVSVEHGSLTNFLSSMRRRPGLSAGDVLLAVTTVTFDIAGLELWLPLTTGASVILASRDEIADPQRLIALLEKSNATVMQATPATWEMLLAAGWRGDPRLKILCGGEAVAGSLADELRARCSSVWNMYGPTETTIWSSLHEANGGEAAVVPIGRPIGNTSMHVLDQNMQPVPIGVRGELYIGGAGVARGYLDAPELTAERFVRDPFSEKVGARLYRTGDAARRRRDGTLEFLGRLDRQIKIRGYRIEPAEIEAALRQHPFVQQAVVGTRARAGEKQLVAYLVSSARETDLEPAELSRFLREKLPDYMVPSTFVRLKSFPLTANGKLDWDALPVPQPQPSEVALILPRDAIENRLAKIWEEVLDVHPVGVTDSFFELGGHSLLATRLFARIEKRFGKRLPLGTLFEAPTIEKLAAILRQQSWVSSSLLQVQAGDSAKAPIFFVQARVGYYALAAELGLDQPVYVVPTDDLFLQETERSIEDLAKELAQRIRAQQADGPYYLGGWCLAGRIAFAVACELWRQGEEVAFLAIIDMPAPGYIRLSRLRAIPSVLGRLGWQLRYALHGNRAQRMDWIVGGFRAVDWQVRCRAWQLARFFFRRIHHPLPQALRHPTRLMAEAARQDRTTSYPGRITLFRPSEMSFPRSNRPDLGWGPIAAGGVEVFQIAGLKRTLLRTNAIQVGRRMKESLARAQSKPRTESSAPGLLPCQIEKNLLYTLP